MDSTLSLLAHLPHAQRIKVSTTLRGGGAGGDAPPNRANQLVGIYGFMKDARRVQFAVRSRQSSDHDDRDASQVRVRGDLLAYDKAADHGQAKVEHDGVVRPGGIE